MMFAISTDGEAKLSSSIHVIKQEGENTLLKKKKRVRYLLLCVLQCKPKPDLANRDKLLNVHTGLLRLKNSVIIFIFTAAAKIALLIDTLVFYI